MKPIRRLPFPAGARLAALCLTGSPCLGQIHALYDFDPANTPQEVSIDTEPSTTASDFQGNPGGGLSGFGYSSSTNSYFLRTQGTPATTTLSEALANDTYAGFTLTNTSGGTIDLSQLAFDSWMTTNGPARDGNIAVFTSLTGFDPGDELATVEVTNPAAIQHSVLLDDPAFTGVPDATVIEVRFYFYDASDGSQPIYRLDNVELSTVDPIMILDPAGPDADLAFGTTFAAAPGDLANRTVRYTNTSAVNDIEILSITLPDDGGGVFSLVSPPATPFTLDPGASFDVEVAALSAAGTSGNVGGELAIDTDEDTAENPQDKTLPISAAFYPPFSVLIDNPTLDIDRAGWVNGAPHIQPGPASPGGVRPKGKGDIGGASTVPDAMSNSIATGASDFQLTFKFAILDDAVIPQYTGFPPDGEFVERAMQLILFGNESALPGFNTVEDSHMDNALVNIGYFYNGVVPGGGPEGFYLYDGAGWTHLSELGTIEGSIDGADGSADGGRLINITSASLAGNVATIDAGADPHGLAVGSGVAIQDLVFATTDPNGYVTIESVPTPTTFTYSLTGPDESFDASAGMVDVDLGDGILDPGDPNDTINVYELKITGTDFGGTGASYGLSISAANSLDPAASITGLTTYHSIPLDDPTALPAAVTFTTGDNSSSSGNGAATALNGFNTSFWVDELFVWSGTAPATVLAATVGDPTLDVFDTATEASSTLTIANTGSGGDLTVTSVSLAGTGFSLDPTPATPIVLRTGESADFTLSFDKGTAGIGAGEVVNGSLEVVSDAPTNPTETVVLRGSYTDYANNLVKNGSFDVLAPQDNDRFTGWTDGGIANILQVPGLPAGSANACYFSANGPWVQNAFEGGASEMVADVYFAFKDTTERQLNLLVNTTNNTTAPLNIALLGGVLQTFQGANGAGGGFVDVLTPSPALEPSEDVGGDGSLDDPGDTKNVYRLRITCSGWGTASASYELELFDESDTSLGTSGSLTDFRTDGSSDHLAHPAGYLRFSSEFGSNPGFWIDEVSATGSLVIPAGDLVITSVTRTGSLLTITFEGEPGVPESFSVTRSADLTTTFSEATLDTAVTEDAPGEYSVIVDESADGDRHFYRVEN